MSIQLQRHMIGMVFSMRSSSKEGTVATHRESEIGSFASDKLAQTRARTSYPWKSFATKEGEFAKTMKEPRTSQLELEATNNQALNYKEHPIPHNTEDKKVQGILEKLKTYMEKCERFEQSLNRYNEENQFMTEIQSQEFSLQCYILKKQIEMFHENYSQVFNEENVTYIMIIRKYLITTNICTIMKFIHKQMNLALH